MEGEVTVDLKIEYAIFYQLIDLENYGNSITVQGIGAKSIGSKYFGIKNNTSNYKEELLERGKGL